MAEQTYVYPEDFFNIPHPTSPWISIQFRTKIPANTKQSLTNAEYWEDITVGTDGKRGPNNHFGSCTIEDASGFQKITLSLFDKNFYRLESLISKSIVAARDADKIVQQEDETPKTDVEGYFEFHVSNHAMINLRLRFGYSAPPDDETYIDSTSVKDDEWINRMNDKKPLPVIRTPWLYFQLFGVKFNMSNSGLVAQLSAMSMVDSFLSRAKLVKKYAIMKGTPKNILLSLNETLKNVSKPRGGTTPDLTIDIEDDPIEVTNDEGVAQIEIHMGGTVDGLGGFRSLRSVFNELVGKVAPRLYSPETQEDVTKNVIDGQENVKVENIVRYSYVYVPTEGAAEGVGAIKFYYPDIGSQDFVRTYVWREHGRSIVRNLEVNSRLDFANLNQQIFERSDADKFNLYATKVSSKDNKPDEAKIVDPISIRESLSNGNYKIAFVTNDQKLNTNFPTESKNLLAYQIISFMNQGIYEGTISLPGDPFYLFDSKMKPYEYRIKLVIMRPAYIDTDGTVAAEEASYLSGEYVVKKITHTINNSGFGTSLDISRYPLT
tara:strand:- start:6117 stop:7760 length:1644 start_codon:yes stop_codon:yes gene_type:complete